MRLWSLHPRYLDQKGLTAAWREALLAQKVLQGETQGYRHHPQLWRFRQANDPLAAVGAFLQALAEEAGRRGYHFDAAKIIREGFAEKLPVTAGQMAYEWAHLQSKLRVRCPPQYERNQGVALPEPAPVFVVVPGEVEDWEKR